MNQYVPSHEQLRIAHALSRKFSQPWGWVALERLHGQSVRAINQIAADADATSNGARTPGEPWTTATAVSNGERILRFVNRTGTLEWRLFENGRTDVLIHDRAQKPACRLWFSLVRQGADGAVVIKQLSASVKPQAAFDASQLTTAHNSVLAVALELGMTRTEVHDYFAPLMTAARGTLVQ